MRRNTKAEPGLSGEAGIFPALSRLAALEGEAARLVRRYDHVTLYPNRLQFLDDFAAMAVGSKPHLLVLMTLADARHYNEILRALGHSFAEDFVRAGAAQLTRHLPATLAVYHVSVLSFAFIIEHDGSDAPPPIALALARDFSGTVTCNDIPIKTRVGIGLVPLNETNRDASEVLRAALAASQDSRRVDAGYAFYDQRSDAAHKRAFRILTDLPDAIANPGQLSLHFQPRISMDDGRCAGAEALLRWRHPSLGQIPPGEFIPLVEQTALIGPLTDWVLDAALIQTRLFLEAGRELRVSINASPANLSEVGFDARLLALCADHDVAPEHIEVEFTEGMLASNFERASRQLKQLQRAGIEVAIDDFGSGFSNLSHLTAIPADVLKIDQAFIRPLGENKADEFLVRQIIAIAKGLDFRICAEGIETAETYALLRELGCDEGQGYHMGRPMPPDAFEAWFRATY